MSRLLDIEIDVKGLVDALDRLGDIAERHCKNAAAVTAGRVQSEARARVRRATGHTAEAITVDEGAGPLGGYRVYVGPTRNDKGLSRPDNLPIWLEFGTGKMTAQPFLLSSARLEESAHERRLAEAIQDAIDEAGLGS